MKRISRFRETIESGEHFETQQVSALSTCCVNPTPSITKQTPHYTSRPTMTCLDIFIIFREQRPEKMYFECAGFRDSNSRCFWDMLWNTKDDHRYQLIGLWFFIIPWFPPSSESKPNVEEGKPFFHRVKIQREQLMRHQTPLPPLWTKSH